MGQAKNIRRQRLSAISRTLKCTGWSISANKQADRPDFQAQNQ